MVRLQSRMISLLIALAVVVVAQPARAVFGLGACIDGFGSTQLAADLIAIPLDTPLDAGPYALSFEANLALKACQPVVPNWPADQTFEVVAPLDCSVDVQQSLTSHEFRHNYFLAETTVTGSTALGAFPTAKHFSTAVEVSLEAFETGVGWSTPPPGPISFYPGHNTVRWHADNRFVNVAGRFQSAMIQNPHLKVLVTSGYYDLATPFFATEYTFNHMDLTREARANISMTY
jgi:hypothetical protein